MKDLNALLNHLFFPLYDLEKQSFLLSDQALENLQIHDFIKSLASCPNDKLYLLENLPSYEEYLINTRQVISEASFVNFCDDINQLINIQINNPHIKATPITNFELSSIAGRFAWSNYLSAIDIMNTAYKTNHNIYESLIKQLVDWGYRHPETVLAQCVDFLQNHTVIATYFSAQHKDKMLFHELLNIHQKAAPSESRKKSEEVFIKNISINNSIYSHLEENIKADFIENIFARPRYGKYLFINSVEDFTSNSDIDFKYQRRFYYGESLAILDAVVKFNSTFTQYDSFHIPNDTVTCNYYHFHILLAQDNDLLHRLAQCAVKNDLSLINMRPDYVEAQLPAIDLFSEGLYQIHFSSNEVEKEKLLDIKGYFDTYGVKTSYGEEIIPKELVDHFFKAIMTNQYSEVTRCLKEFKYLALIKYKRLLPMELAAGLGHSQTLAVLLKTRAFTGSFIFSRTLAFALLNGQESIVSQLVNAGAKISEAKEILKAFELPPLPTLFKCANEEKTSFLFWSNSDTKIFKNNNNGELDQLGKVNPKK